ncbi:MAG: MmpS family transport accessory protein [Bacteroidota bacterium]
MKKVFLLLIFATCFWGCDSGVNAEEDDMVRTVRYEVDGNAQEAIIEFIDGDLKVKGTGIEEIPWSRDIELTVGDKLYLSAWSSESGGGSVSIRVFVDGEIFRSAEDAFGIRTRISGNAF